MMKRARPGLFGYPSENPIIREQQRRQLVAYVIKDVLASAGLRVGVNPGSVHIRDQLIFFDTRVRRVLSKAIYGGTFPRVRRGKFFHYTSVEAFAGIADSGDLRLYSLRKRDEQPVRRRVAQPGTTRGLAWAGGGERRCDQPRPSGIQSILHIAYERRESVEFRIGPASRSRRYDREDGPAARDAISCRR